MVFTLFSLMSRDKCGLYTIKLGLLIPSTKVVYCRVELYYIEEALADSESIALNFTAVAWTPKRSAGGNSRLFLASLPRSVN